METKENATNEHMYLHVNTRAKTTEYNGAVSIYIFIQ